MKNIKDGSKYSTDRQKHICVNIYAQLKFQFKRENEAEEIFGDIMAENFPEMTKDTNIIQQIQ